MACFERVLKTNPDHALAYQNLGNVLSRRGELDAAAAALRERSAASPACSRPTSTSATCCGTGKARRRDGLFAAPGDPAR